MFGCATYLNITQCKRIRWSGGRGQKDNCRRISPQAARLWVVIWCGPGAARASVNVTIGFNDDLQHIAVEPSDLGEAEAEAHQASETAYPVR